MFVRNSKEVDRENKNRRKKGKQKSPGGSQAEAAANPRHHEEQKKWQINVCIAYKQIHDKHKDQLPLPQARWSKC